MATDKTGSGAAASASADPKASDAKSADAKTDSTATADAEVAQGRTLRHGEGDNKKKYRAGETVTLPVDEIERLRALGFLKPAEEPAAAAGRTDAGVSVTSKDPANTGSVKPKGAA
jgi:hypothetical protein